MNLKTIEAGTGQFVALKAQQSLRVVNPRGGQTGDLVAFREGDLTEWLSNGRTFDLLSCIYLSAGHILYSNKSSPMLTIVHDDVGQHDFLYAACSAASYKVEHGGAEQKNCLSNIVGALAQMGVLPHIVPTPFNYFMNARVNEDGRLLIAPSRARAGDTVVFKAEMDLAVALTACPALTCNGGILRPLQYEIVG